MLAFSRVGEIAEEGDLFVGIRESEESENNG